MVLSTDSRRAAPSCSISEMKLWIGVGKREIPDATSEARERMKPGSAAVGRAVRSPSRLARKVAIGP